jgi:hypothetical protein
MRFSMLGTERMRIDAAGNVGIGTSSPGAKLEVNGGGSATTGGTLIVRQDGDTNADGIALTSSNATSHRFWKDSGGKLNIGPSNSPSALVQDLTGHLLVGKTAANSAIQGVEARVSGQLFATANGAQTMFLNRLTSDGAILDFRKDGTTVGSIGTVGGELYIESGDVGVQFNASGNNIVPYANGFQDGVTSLGASANRFKDLHLSGTGYFGTEVGIGTSSPASTLEIAKNDQTNGATLSITNSFDGGSWAAGDTVGTVDFRVDDVSTTQKVRGQIKVFDDAASGNNSYPFANAMSFSTGYLNTLNERMRIDSSGRVGIGTSSPSETLAVESISNNAILLNSPANRYNAVGFQSAGVDKWWMGRADTDIIAGDAFFIGADAGNATDAGGTNAKLVIDSTGNVLVGKTATGSTVDGFEARASGYTALSDTSGAALNVNRNTTDGNIVTFTKDGTTVGSIGTFATDITIGKTGAGLRFEDSTQTIRPHNISTNTGNDANVTLGSSDTRFKDIYRSGSTYSTSDRNMKQDIRELTDAERNVAVACKGLLKAFRFIDAVEKDGDDANIHFGVIAQELAEAFEAEGLDANDYQVYKSATITDEDDNEQTRLNVCYENLLAFIIAAL